MSTKPRDGPKKCIDGLPVGVKFNPEKEYGFWAWMEDEERVPIMPEREFRRLMREGLYKIVPKGYRRKVRFRKRRYRSSWLHQIKNDSRWQIGIRYQP